jgi:hypothetical protein
VAQLVGLLTVENHVQFQVSLCCMYGGQSGSGTIYFCQSASVFLCRLLHCIPIIIFHLSSEGWAVRQWTPLQATPQFHRRSLAQSANRSEKLKSSGKHVTTTLQCSMCSSWIRRAYVGHFSSLNLRGFILRLFWDATLLRRLVIRNRTRPLAGHDWWTIEDLKAGGVAYL